jgi:hypothetical protein|tara:strand:+ start:52 stop:438 length:387 start_codon:yes stop_codon:yes gene_type:complete
MFNKFFSYLKIVFYIANFVLIVLYVFPGSILGWLLYGNVALQPQITSDFLVSSNHVYAFTAISILGYLSYEKNKLNFIFIYLFFLSILLEVLHLIIPNRGFEFSDLFGNVLGVLLIYSYQKIYDYFYD